MKACDRMMAIGWLAALLAMPALTEAAPPPAGSAAPAPRDGKAGVDAWRRGDFSGALAIWRPLAEAGDAEAQFNLAQAYRLGRGVRQDEKMATRWYERAARQGLTPAEANYGLLLLEKDRAAALPWLEKAAAKGDPRAQYVIATALFNGDPPPRDPVRAYALMSRAAVSGLPQAVQSLTEMDGYLSPAQRQRGQELSAELARVAPLRATASTVATAPAGGAASASSLASSPASSRAATAPPARALASPAGGRWRIQLGAFSDGARAEALWRRISAGNAALTDKQHFLVSAGAVTRLQAGPFASRAIAEQACAGIRSAGQACFAALAP